jgi:(p)ppGpp synthase/HD superfamily hydrolase
MIGFSPRIHHAMSFAEKHHAGQRRKGRNTAYITHSANVALILARYNRPEEEITAGLLHDVIEDCAEDPMEVHELRRKIQEKFGPTVYTIVDYVTEVKRDTWGGELPAAVRKRDYLKRLGEAPEGSLWVCAADKVHNASALLIDILHAKDRERVWAPFSGGKESVAWWYTAVADKLESLKFQGAIMPELRYVASMISAAAITHDADLPTPVASV